MTKAKTETEKLKDLQEKYDLLEQEKDAFKNQFEIIKEEIDRYKRTKGEEMKISFLVNDFRKTTLKDQTPILDAIRAQSIDAIRLKDFLDEFGTILEHGTAFEAFELHRSNVFPQISNVAEALSQGQQCFTGFLKRFYAELQVGSNTESIEPENVETL